MTDNFYSPGQFVGESIDTGHPMYSLAQAVAQSPFFSFIERRRIHEEDCDIIVVNASDGTYGPHNQARLKRTERLALCYSSQNAFPWDVRALRQDFPVTLHQNQTVESEAKSLCLYDTAWKNVQRSWTPQSFLRRILWWLRETANGTLHPNDQALEQLFFHNGFQLVLPHDFLNESLTSQTPYYIEKVDAPGTQTRTFVASKSPTNVQSRQWAHLCFTVQAIENCPVSNVPSTLGELHEELKANGSSVMPALGEAILAYCDNKDGNDVSPLITDETLIIIAIPRMRDGNIERHDVLGFLVLESIHDIGLGCGVLLKAPGDTKVYPDTFGKQEKDDWQSFILCPVEVKLELDKARARQLSGLDETECDVKGVLAGVGSLGSILANIWSRIGWGTWTYVDEDILQPHNIAKHFGLNLHIGQPKSLLMQHLTNNTYLDLQSRAIVADVTAESDSLADAINHANVIIDATTTVYVPRELSLRDNVPRVISTFITPSGQGAVILAEDQSRESRLVNIEAQYYRAVLTSDDWGVTHLVSPEGQRVGAGCMDISNVLSYENLSFYGALLAKQLRLTTLIEHSRIAVWHSSSQLNQLSHVEIDVMTAHSIELGDWTVHWDDGFTDALGTNRKEALPNETGGVLLGVVDTASRHIQLVLGLQAPRDSDSSPSFFYRGHEGLRDVLDACQNLTAGMVTYVGEWHSHPIGHSAMPSGDDVKLIQALTEKMQMDGLPAMMVIMSDSELTITTVSRVRDQTLPLLEGVPE